MQPAEDAVEQYVVGSEEEATSNGDQADSSTVVLKAATKSQFQECKSGGKKERYQYPIIGQYFVHTLCVDHNTRRNN